MQLQYVDKFSQRTVTTEQTITAEMSPNMESYNPTWDLEIYRNVTIQRTAEGMREIDRLFDAEQYKAAWRLAVELEQQLNQVARLTGDQQMQADAALMQRYQQTLSEAVWETQNRAPQMGSGDTGDRPYRGSDQSTPEAPEVKLQ